MTELVVIWNGSHGNADRDLLCTFPADVKAAKEPEARELSKRRLWEPRDTERQALLDLLATRDRWRLCTLRRMLGMDYGIFHGLMYRLKRHGLVRRIDHGIVALVRQAA